MMLHEGEHGAAGLGEAALIGGPAHGLADGGCGELWDHARGLGRRERGAVGEDAGIDHQQLVGRAGLAAEHDPAEAHFGVDREDELRELCLADTPVEGGTELREFGILLLVKQARPVPDGFAMHVQIAEELQAYITAHRTTDGFLESRPWLSQAQHPGIERQQRAPR